jgi:hypothetical protein
MFEVFWFSLSLCEGLVFDERGGHNLSSRVHNELVDRPLQLPWNRVLTP